MLVFLAHTGDKYSHSRKGALYVCWTRHAKSMVFHAGNYTVGKSTTLGYAHSQIRNADKQITNKAKHQQTNRRGLALGRTGTYDEQRRRIKC